MNRVEELGRLTRDPILRTAANGTEVVRYKLAVQRRYQKEGEQTADFIPCIAFGKAAEFAARNFRQGSRIAVSGRIQTGSYTDQSGKKIYTMDVVVEEQEFAESKRSESGRMPAPENDFMEIPEGMEAEMPFA